MKELMSALFVTYITPNVEDEELLKAVAALYQELTPAQTAQCEKVNQMYTSKAFLLGLRTGAEMERFLEQDAVG